MNRRHNGMKMFEGLSFSHVIFGCFFAAVSNGGSVCVLLDRRKRELTITIFRDVRISDEDYLFVREIVR